jgi:uncharacterized membrane protein
MSPGTTDTARGLTVPSQRRRLGVSFGVAAVIGLVASPFLPWQAAVLIGWDALAASYTARIWALITRLDAATTQALATREDNSRTAADVLLVAASVASLVGSAALLVLKTSTNDNNLAVILTIIAVGTVALSWATVHTVFTLRYARLYYTDNTGGIDFSSDDQPDYTDFAYVAFTVGMTFQVSDTDISSRAIRRAILRHALLSYMFGAVILAVTINVLGNLFA